MTHEAGIEAASDAYMDGEPDFYLADRVSEIIQAYLSASGMVLVPRVATDFMASNLYAYGVSHGDIEEAYKILVDSAPDPFKSKP